MTKTLSWGSAHEARPWSTSLLYLAATLLRTASDTLAGVAERSAAAQAARRATHGVVEFHALHRDAGAPEGALYVNGELVGYIDVKRL